MTRIGVLAMQGAFAEHEQVLSRLLGDEGEVFQVRRVDDVERADGFVLPGGESTTIEKLLDAGRLRAPLARRIAEGTPTLATCAGAILLASAGEDDIEAADTELIGALDASIERNAFGRQRESFEAAVEIDALAEAFPGVFIRAPAFTDTWGRAEPWARLPDGRVVGVEQGNVLALSFHPELSADVRVHELFLARLEQPPAARASASSSTGSCTRSGGSS